MIQFRERNPIPIAIIGLVVIAAVLFLSFNAGSLPLLGGGGKTYHAQFAEASGLRSGDDVRMAGIKVGTVSSVKIDGGHVRVAMKVSSGTQVFAGTHADIKIKTLLGAMYVALTPAGQGPLRGDIPLKNTTTPLIVTDAFSQLATNLDQIDTTQLAASFNALSTDFENTPSTVRDTLQGLTALSHTISSRDQQLQTLLAHAQGVTTALASRDSEVTSLINDGQTVLQLVNDQRDVIHELLVNTTTFSQQLTALVGENRAALAPALKNLGATVDILTKNQANLDNGIHLLAPFVRDFTNTLGTGQYFDTQIANLTDLANPGCFTVKIGSTTISSPLTTGQGTGCL
jgi:phospholipid/cholesterol/gamma-HCH transport system substrate-binding protein